MIPDGGSEKLIRIERKKIKVKKMSQNIQCKLEREKTRLKKKNGARK